MSRLFSSASATASFIESISLPSLSSLSRRGVFVRLGAGTERPAYGASGLGKCERGFAYSPTTNGFGGALGVWLAEGACGMGADWSVCAQTTVAKTATRTRLQRTL